MLTGRIPMPSAEEMESYMRNHEQRLEQTRPYYARGVSYIKYMDELAEQIGARPSSVGSRRILSSSRSSAAARLARRSCAASLVLMALRMARSSWSREYRSSR